MDDDLLLIQDAMSPDTTPDPPEDPPEDPGDPDDTGKNDPYKV